MRFWFEHSAEVSLRDQIVTQVRLGILCGELEAGERLPSIRELARRFHLHPNTVSAGYQELVDSGWVESRRGSGVYARAHRQLAEGDSEESREALLDRLIAQMFRAGRKLGLEEAAMAERVAWLAAHGVRQKARLASVLLIEPDPELRAIVLAELRSLTSLPVVGCGFGECDEHLSGALVVALPSKIDTVEAELRAAGKPRPGAGLLRLGVRSVPESLAARLPARADQRGGMLIGVCSGWPMFAGFARNMLVAAGFEADALLVRDPREPGWQTGLEETVAVVCDLATAPGLPAGKALVFRILDEQTEAQLCARLATA